MDHAEIADTNDVIVQSPKAAGDVQSAANNILNHGMYVYILCTYYITGMANIINSCHDICIIRVIITIFFRLTLMVL